MNRSNPAIGATARSTISGDDAWIPSVCRMCGSSCGIRIHRVNGVLVNIEGNPNNPHNDGKICAKGLAAIMSLYDPGRLRSCLRRTNPRRGPDQDPGWKKISWEEAMDEMVSRLGTIASDDPRKLMLATSTGEVGMSNVVTEAFAQAFGTPNETFGAFFGTHVRSAYLNVGSLHTDFDLDHCRLLVMFGSQKGSVSGHLVMKEAQEIHRARDRGMKLVIFDPVCTPIGSKANQWLPLIPGTDAVVAMAMLHVILNELEVMDEAFLTRQTNAAYLVDSSGHYVRHPESGQPLVWDRSDGVAKAYDDPSLVEPELAGEFQAGNEECRPALELLRARVAQFPPGRAEEISTVPASTIRGLAKEFCKTANIGGTILIDGVRMPLRPVCALPDSRGALNHAADMWTGTAIQLLNVVVGAVDVPGGVIAASIVGPGERLRVKEGPDGMIVPTAVTLTTGLAPDLPVSKPNPEHHYPGVKACPPETLQLHELFPVGRNPRPMLVLGRLDYAHLLPYQPEMLVLYGTNVMMTGADPRRFAEAMEKIPFIVGLGHRMEETIECADLVFPVAHHLERLDFPMNELSGWVTSHHWYYTARQPAVEPPPGVPHIIDVFMEWADRLGLSDKVNQLLNGKLQLAQGFKLEGERRYSNAEIVERRMQSLCGKDHDRRWFQDNGLVVWERTLGERYPRAVLKLPRVPVYFPHIMDRGEELREVVERLGVEWDLSLYQPLPVWEGCWSHKTRQPDQLYGVNYKLPFHTSSSTQTNPWLFELAERHRLALYVMLNSKTAERLGIADEEEVEVTGTTGYTARARARVSECVHPDVAAFASCFGHWARGESIALGKGVHFNSFIPYVPRGLLTLSGNFDMCTLLTIRKASRVR